MKSIHTRLADISPELHRILKIGPMPPTKYSAADIQCSTVRVTMRDGVRLATDLYLPPKLPAPVIVVRTPYGRGWEGYGMTAALHGLARRGYVAVSQDCRGTGDSEPADWDYFVYETEDGYDCVEWITQQDWYGGFIGSFSGSYVGMTQWAMAAHDAMSTLIPSNCTLGIGTETMRLYMFLNAFAHVVGKGDGKIAIPIEEMERWFEEETMAGGYYNETLHRPISDTLLKRFPQLGTMTPSESGRWLWSQYCAMTCAQRVEFVKQALDTDRVTTVEFENLPAVFGQEVSVAAVTIPYATEEELCRSIQAPPLIRIGWYDWHVRRTLASFQMLRRAAKPEVAENARLIISNYAHNMPGYYVGAEENPELLRMPSYFDQIGLMTRWFKAVREGTVDRWPRVIYYLMGANEWRTASDWPVPEAEEIELYIAADGLLTREAPSHASPPDSYTYDPHDPTPTVGGSIVSYLYRPGSVDVSSVQGRADVLTYTSVPLPQNLDVVGPIRMILYASSSAPDTDFAVRLSDVFPDGRALQLQNGVLRARYRDPAHPELLEPGQIYRFEVDMWATANRFKAGHRLRIDISSADFPHYDRNANRGGEPGDPIPAAQSIYHDPGHPSRVIISILNPH